MKILVTALVALSVIAGSVVPSIAAEGFSIRQLDEDGRAGHNG